MKQKTIDNWNAMKRRAMLKASLKPKKAPRKRRKARISKLTGQPIISRQKAERLLWTEFSLYIRKRDGQCVLGMYNMHVCRGPLQAGHVIGRTRRATKYDEQNVFAQCRASNYDHRYHPEIYIDWFISRFGDIRYSDLVAKSLRPAKALSTKECLELAAHYKHLTETL